MDKYSIYELNELLNPERTAEQENQLIRQMHRMHRMQQMRAQGLVPGLSLPANQKKPLVRRGIDSALSTGKFVGQGALKAFTAMPKRNAKFKPQIITD